MNNYCLLLVSLHYMPRATATMAKAFV